MSKVALITGVTGQDGAYLAEFGIGRGITGTTNVVNVSVGNTVVKMGDFRDFNNHE